MNKGFTMIELVVAIVIFAVGILGIAKMQMLSISGNASGNYLSEATNALSSQAEDLMAKDISDVSLEDGDHPKPGDKIDKEVKTSTGHVINVTWTVSKVVPASPNLKKVILKADWQEQNKDSLVTYHTSMGLVKGQNE